MTQKASMLERLFCGCFVQELCRAGPATGCKGSVATMAMAKCRLQLMLINLALGLKGVASQVGGRRETCAVRADGQTYNSSGAAVGRSLAGCVNKLSCAGRHCLTALWSQCDDLRSAWATCTLAHRCAEVLFLGQGAGGPSRCAEQR